MAADYTIDASATKLTLSGLISHFVRRDGNYLERLRDEHQAAMEIGAADEVRFLVGKAGETPILDLDQDATANGSVVEIRGRNPAEIMIRVRREDISGREVGAYDYSIVVVEGGGAGVRHTIQTGVFVLHDNQRGTIP